MEKLINFYFYIVLDNVKTLFKVEKAKLTLQKLSIIQAQCSPPVFSTIVINDALVQDMHVFKENPNTFDESNFAHFIFSPLSEDKVKNTIRGILMCKYIEDRITPPKERQVNA